MTAAERQRIAVEAATRRVSAPVLSALRELNADASPTQQKSLDRLAVGGAACLVTGQQLGVALGPLFLLSKITALLNDAVALERESGVPIVPIFWLQSEDHDLDEICAVSVRGDSGHLRSLRLDHPELADPVRSVGALILGDCVIPFLSELREALSVDRTSEYWQAVESSYTPEHTFAQAFAGLLRFFFRDTPLLVIDPRHPLVRAESASVFERVLRMHEQIAQILLDRQHALIESGEPTPVQLRPDSPLVFFHPDGPDGPRTRFTVADETCKIPFRGTIARQELLERIHRSPDQFSTSALLRPLLQDTLLPSAGSVLGPSELQYFRQLEPLRPLFGLSISLTLPRAEVLVLEPKIRRTADLLGLPHRCLLLPSDTLRAKIESSLVPHDLLPDALGREIHEALGALLTDIDARLRAFDAVYAESLTRPKEKIERALEGFIERYRTQIEQRQSVAFERLRKLEELLRPGGAPQERVYAFLQFWCTYDARLRDSFLRAIVPFERGPVIAEPETQ